MKEKGIIKNLLSIAISLASSVACINLGPDIEQRSLNTKRRVPEGALDPSDPEVALYFSKIRNKTRVKNPQDPTELGNAVLPFRPDTLMYKRGKARAIIGQFIWNTVPTWFYTKGGDALKYYNASNITFSQEIENNGKILFSSFVDINVFFLVTQEAEGEPTVLNSYFYHKYGEYISPKGDPIQFDPSVKIYKVARFGDTKIYYICGRNQVKDNQGLITKDQWVFYKYHGFSNQILQNYTIDVTDTDFDYNTAEAMPSNNFDNYTYIYIVQGVENPRLDLTPLETINLRVTVIKRSNPTKIFIKKIYSLNYQEQIAMKGYQVAGLGYFFPNIKKNNFANFKYFKQYGAILTREENGNRYVSVNRVKVTYNDTLQRLQVFLVNTPAKPPYLFYSCDTKLITQVGRGQIVTLCRDPVNSMVTIHSFDYQGFFAQKKPFSYQPFPPLSFEDDTVVEDYAFIKVQPYGPSAGGSDSPMMLLKYSSVKKKYTKVITSPFSNFGYYKMNTKWEFVNYTDFFLCRDDYHYFVVKDDKKGRTLSSANLGNMFVEVDLETYTGNEYIISYGLGDGGDLTTMRTKFKLKLVDNIYSFWNSGLDQGGPVTNQIYKFEKRIFLIDPEVNYNNRYFVISGNLDAPQRVLPDDSPSRLDIQFYTNSTVQNITIGFELEKFYLNNTILNLRKTFFRPRAASTNPPRRKVLEVFTNCSLTMLSEFKTMYCFNHFFQGYPKTADPNDAYLGAVGFSRSFFSGRAGEIFELVGDRVVNLIVLSANSNRKSRRKFGIQVPAWDKSKRNSTFVSDYTPPQSQGFYSPFYITCNLTTPTDTRNCTHYEIRGHRTFDPVTKTVQNKYYLKLLEKWDLNQIPEFTNQHVLKIGAAGTLSRIFYITREFGAAKSDIKVLTRYNYTKIIDTNGQEGNRLFRKIDQFELPFNLTDDMNFDICLGSAKLIMFISPSAQTPKDKMFPPTVYVYLQIRANLVNPFTGFYSRYYWQKIYLDDFNFTTIRRLQCFDNYFAVIGDDKKIPGMTRLSVLEYSFIFDRYSNDQVGQDGNVAFGGTLDPFNLRRYDETLPNPEAGLEYQIKFIRLTQRSQLVFQRAVFQVMKATFNPWYHDESLLKGNPPDTSAESTLSKNYTLEIVLEAKALFHQSIYFLKDFVFQDNQPANINQTVYSTWGPPHLNLTNSARFSYINLIDRVQTFKSKLGNVKNKIVLKKQNYNLSELVEAAGTIISMDVYFTGGEVYNVTACDQWPLLTDKLYQMRQRVPNRDKIIRRFTTIVDFSVSTVIPNKTTSKEQKTSKDNKNEGKSEKPVPPNHTYKVFTSNIYLKYKTKPIDTITTTEAWENVDIHTGYYSSTITAGKLSAVIFQSQYFNTTNDRYQTKVLAHLYKDAEKETYFSMDAYESRFYEKTNRHLYIREENNQLIPYMYIWKDFYGGIPNYIYLYKGEANFTGFKLKAPGYIDKSNFKNQRYSYIIKGPNRVYVIGRWFDESHFPTLIKAEYNFNTSTWMMPINFIPGKGPLKLTQINKQINALYCAQHTEFGDNAICLFYAGDGSNFVVIYDPSDPDVHWQGQVTGIKEIYIPPSNLREYEDIYQTFDINDNLIIKRIRNRSREYQVTYSEEGKALQNPDMYTYGGFLVWDLARETQKPVRQKYFTYRFTDFTLTGDSVWTCSPMDGESAVFSLSLSTDITNQELEIPDVEYLRTHFHDTFLRANFLNGTVIKIPFDSLFKLPAKSSFIYAYIGLGLVIILIVLMCVAFKVKEKKSAMEQQVKVTQRKKTENIKKVKQFIPEGQNNSTVDQSKYKVSKEMPSYLDSFDQSKYKLTKDNPTYLTETSQDVLL